MLYRWFETAYKIVRYDLRNQLTSNRAMSDFSKIAWNKPPKDDIKHTACQLWK